MSHIFNTSGLLPIFKFDHMSHNQGRSFGPLLGLFLVNLLAKAVSAKYLSYFPYQYDPGSWLAYNKPVPHYNHHSYYSQWYPIKNPYESAYPTLTTTSPYVDEHPIEYDYQGNYDYPYYPHYDKLVPSASNNVQKRIEHVKTTTEETPTTTAKEDQTSPIVTTTIAPTQEPIPAESRRQPQKNRRRSPNRGNRYPQRRRRPTTPSSYYDSYEDYYQPNRRRKPADNFYDDDDDDYYDSFESTTRYFKKPKRKPTRKNRPQNQNDDSLEIESNTERFSPNTEIVIVRQAQTTTTTTTASTSTTEPTTIITNTTVSSTTPSSNNTYGYGPSNGNEHVSFTYGPPVGKYQYQVPYIDWYTQEETKNAIVKRVRDIVHLDDRLNLK